jgi:hypothetical protein
VASQQTPKIEMEQKQPVPFEMDLKPEIASGVYSNFVLISHSPSDFVLDFARILPGMPKPEVASRIIMAPEHAKRLLMALQENIFKYEQEFGKIQLPNEGSRTIAPFKVGGNGEA